ncbi:Asp-tRNA(Asn)/Glu-tRNA(Gln) amidotransferase GatCAB subunit C [candidate division WWE3 bacterium]|nr:Asp-tRNA(Asn)/Glu-tRNA(Gln) amidotransferase GatCAB subunit C [candidate division WWE3 bacterium]
MDRKISLEATQHIAELVNLTLTQEELEKLSIMLSDTLDYVEVLEELDTAKTPPTFQVTGLENVFQTEKNHICFTQDAALANAKETKDGKFVTEAVFDR